MLFVSILGDSISTYEGYNPEGYSVFYDKTMQMQNGLSSVYDTWWAKVNQALHAYLCVNNSYSGSKVTGDAFPAASSQIRTSCLHNGQYSPDMILIYIGFNDFGNGVPAAKRGLKSLFCKDLTCFKDAYEDMLRKIRNNYPNAKIVCGTLMRTVIKENSYWVFPEDYRGIAFEDYNNAIRKSCKKAYCCLADLSALNMRYETLDGTHPTNQGHETIALAWVTCLKQLGFLV